MADNMSNVSPSKINRALGARIRAQRNKGNIKISELAERTGLTASTISQVERALISPSIATLKKICDAMNIPISYLFEDSGEEEVETKAPEIQPAVPDIQESAWLAGNALNYSVNLMGHSPVVHRENRKFLSPSPGIRFYLLNPNLAGPIELIYNEYDPGTSTGPAQYSHPGSECGLILSGELIVQIKDATYTLKEGDSITFNSNEPHLKRNDSDKICTCIWANTPPWF